MLTSVYLNIYPLPNFLFNWLSIYPFTQLSIYPFFIIYLSNYLSNCLIMSIYQSKRLFIYLSIYPTFYISNCLYIQLSIYLTVYISNCLSIYQSTWYIIEARYLICSRPPCYEGSLGGVEYLSIYLVYH